MNRRRILALLVAVTVGLVGAITALGADAKSEQKNRPPIVIGYSIGKTGFLATYDLAVLNGGKMAAAEINARGGVLGRKIKIIDFDTKSQLALSGAGARKLISEGAQFIVGTADYDFGGGAYRAAAAKGLVGIGVAGDTRLGYHGVGPTVFNVYQGSPAEGAVLAEFAYAKGWRKPYTLTDTVNSYPPTVSKYFSQRWKELSGDDVAGKDLFVNNDASIATQISRIRQTDPDVILVASFPPGGASAIKQIRAAGIEAPILGGAGYDGSYWMSGIPNLSNVYNAKAASPNGNDPSAARNAFFRAYKKFAGEASALSLYPLSGYTQIQLLAKGITVAKSTDGKKVSAVIAKLSKYPTLLGPATYAWRARCNVPAGRPFSIFQVQNGKETFLRAMTPKSVPAFKC